MGEWGHPMSDVRTVSMDGDEVAGTPMPTVVVTDDGFASANAAAVDFFDVDDETDLLGTDPLEYVHSGDSERFRLALRRVLRRGTARSGVEYRFLSDNPIRYALAAMTSTTVGTEPAARLFLTDVTRYRRTQRRLLADQRFLGRVIDAMEAAVFVFDDHGDLVLINDAAVETTGYTQARLTEDGLKLIVPEAQRDRLPDIWDPSGGGRTDVDLVTAAGDRIPHEVTGVSVGASDSGDRYLIAVARDVSERKRRERKLRRQNERLTEFAKVVSHDLRNPLEVARSRLALLEDADPQQVASIEASLDRMNDLIDDVLALAQEGQVVDDLASVSVATTARNCWEAVATDGAELRVEDDVWIRTDGSRLRSLLENLFDNSTTHALEDDPAQLTIRVGPIVRDGQRVGFYVEDDGTGIDADDRERIFESGFSTAKGGTGFGLVIVDQIARAHNWSIRVSHADRAFTGYGRTPGATPGTRFEFTSVDLVDR